MRWKERRFAGFLLFKREWAGVVDWALVDWTRIVGGFILVLGFKNIKGPVV